MKRIVLMLALVMSTLVADTRKIESLSEIGSVTKYTEGKSFLDEQLCGIKSESPFGTTLPKWITSMQLNSVLNPENTMGNITLQGIREWRKNSDTFVAIGCYTEGKVDKDEVPYCNDWRGNLKISLSLLEYKEGKINILATTQEPKLHTSWENSQLAYGVDENRGMPSRYIKFDFAPYKLTKNSYAFGIRVGWFEGYSGGGADFEALVLFIQQGEKLVPIFSEPMYSYVNTAGKWNPDGTREHFIDEGKNIVIIQKEMTNGYYDLKVKGLEDKFSKIFVFDKRLNRYVVKK